MRRGTPHAYLFGELLRVVRNTNDKSMREVAEKIGVFAATISQVEHGQRALKEDKIGLWADALEVDEANLFVLWRLCQGWVRVPRKGWVFHTDKETLFLQICNVMDRLAPGAQFSIDLSDIGPEKPIRRRKGVSIQKAKLVDMFDQLNAQQRERVRGYIEAIIEEDK